MKKTKLLAFIASLVLIAPAIAACGGPGPDPTPTPWNDPIAEGETDIKDIKADSTFQDKKVTIRGTVTASAGGTTTGGQNFYVQRHDSAIYVYGAKVGTGIASIAIGNYVEVSGTISIYKELHEVATITALKVVQETGETISAMPITDISTVTNVDSGRMAKVENSLFYNGKITVGTNCSVITTLGTSQVTLRTDKNTSTTVQQGFADIINEAGYQDYLSFTGPIGWYSGPQLALVEGAGVTVSANPTPFDPDAVKDTALSALTLQYANFASTGVSANADLSNFMKGFEVHYTAATTTPDFDCLSVSANNDELIVVAPEKTADSPSFVAGTLGFELFYKGTSYGTGSVNVKIIPIAYYSIQQAIAYDETTKAYVHAGDTGMVVTGYITYIYGDYNAAVIQDGDYAIQLYKLSEFPTNTIKVGNLVRAIGSFSVYNGLVQLQFLSSVQIVKDDKVVAPSTLEVTESVYKSLSITSYAINRKMTATVTYVSGSVTVGSHSTIKVKIGTTDTTLYLNYHAGTDIMTSWKATLDTVSAGDTLAIEGTVGIYNSTFQLLPWIASDIAILN